MHFFAVGIFLLRAAAVLLSLGATWLARTGRQGGNSPELWLSLPLSRSPRTLVGAGTPLQVNILSVECRWLPLAHSWLPIITWGLNPGHKEVKPIESYRHDWIWNVLGFIFWTTECILLLVVIILCIPVEGVIDNITCEVTMFWMLDTSKPQSCHGTEHDVETSAGGVPESLSLGQHHRAAMKTWATLSCLLCSLSNSHPSERSWRSLSLFPVRCSFPGYAMFLGMNPLNH